jgi:hypothetical protein
MLRDGSRESKRNSCISPNGDDFQERLAVHWANLNSMKWMLWNDGVDMAELGMTRVGIGLFQHALAHLLGRNNSEASRPDYSRSSFDFTGTLFWALAVALDFFGAFSSTAVDVS